MKFATLPNGTPDGALAIVSSDHQKALMVTDIAPTLQAALDNWDTVYPALVSAYTDLNRGSVSEAFAFDETKTLSPLPRAYQWADGSAYVTHVELVRKARGAEMPEQFWTDPLMYQGGSDAFLAPYAPIEVSSTDFGIDFEAEVAVITGAVPMGVTPEEARECIRLVMLVNDVSLRNLIPNELQKGFGFFQSKPSSSFSPIALTPDVLGDAWDGGKLHLPLISTLSNKRIGAPNAGVDMTFDFPTLIAHAAKTRPLGPGAIIGSGTVSNTSREAGSSCLAEVRMLEKIETGEITTPFMQYGDTIRIEMLDAAGNTLFGAIEQRVMPYEKTL